MESLSNFDWLQEICQGKVSPQTWHNKKVLRLDEIKHPYKQYTTKYYTGYIDPSKITGIDYAFGYNFTRDLSWLELLNGLRRFNRIRRNIRSYDDIIKHIHNPALGDDKCVYQFENEYVTFSGQHRMCLAMFLEVELVKVDIHKQILLY